MERDIDEPLITLVSETDIEDVTVIVNEILRDAWSDSVPGDEDREIVMDTVVVVVLVCSEETVKNAETDFAAEKLLEVVTSESVVVFVIVTDPECVVDSASALALNVAVSLGANDDEMLVDGQVGERVVECEAVVEREARKVRDSLGDKERTGDTVNRFVCVGEPETDFVIEVLSDDDMDVDGDGESSLLE